MRTNLHRCFAAFLLVSLVSLAAHAEEPASRAEPVEDTGSADFRESGYHLELALLDGAALALGATAVLLASNDHETAGQAAVVPGALVYSIGGPAMHGVYRGSSYSLPSIGLRQGLPLVGALAGYAAAGSCDESDDRAFGDCFLHGVQEVAIGVAIAIPVAMVLDNALLAGPRTLDTEEAGVRLAPTFSYDPVHRAGTIGVGGTL